MKNILLLSCLLISTISYSQRFKEILMWQVRTEAGGIVFGISKNQKDADFIMQDFQKRNANSKYDIGNSSPQYKYSTFSIEKTNDKPVEEFRTIAKKPYKVLSAEDIESIHISKKDGLQKGIDYYIQTRNVKRYYATSRITSLVEKFDKYLIKNSQFTL